MLRQFGLAWSPPPPYRLVVLGPEFSLFRSLCVSVLIDRTGVRSHTFCWWRMLLMMMFHRMCTLRIVTHRVPITSPSRVKYQNQQQEAPKRSSDWWSIAHFIGGRAGIFDSILTVVVVLERQPEGWCGLALRRAVCCFDRNCRVNWKFHTQ